MKRVLAAMVSMLVGVALTLAAVLSLLRATLYIEQMSHPLARGLAGLAALGLGVGMLVGSVLVSTRIAVWLFGGNPDRDSGQPRPRV